MGKSTTAILLANGLKHKGYSVLAVDLDQQWNLTYATNTDEVVSSTYDLLTSKKSAENILIETNQIDLLPANSDLAGIDMEITKIGKEYRLKKALQAMQERYDFIIIDTPPTLSLVTVNALTASDYVFIPTEADIFCLQGLGQLYGTIQAVQQYTNPNLKLGGIIVIKHNPRTILGQSITEMLEQTAKELKTTVLNSRIRNAVVIKEAQAEMREKFHSATDGDSKHFSASSMYYIPLKAMY